MAQIPRPFQIALLGVVLLVFVSVLALHAHGSNPNEPVSASAPTRTAVARVAKEDAARRRADRRLAAHKAQTATHKAQTAASKTVAHETAAHETVAHKTVVHKSVVATHTTAADPHTAVGTRHKVVVTSTHKTTTTPHGTAPVSHKTVRIHTVVTHSAHTPVTPSGRSDSSAPARHKRPAGQLAIEAELAQGKTVMLVFWNPDSAVDREVHSQASALVSGSKGTVVMHAALADQVNMFGSITEVVRVFQTPTILIVNGHGVVSTLTGLTEVFALQQAVSEARHASQ